MSSTHIPAISVTNSLFETTNLVTFSKDPNTVIHCFPSHAKPHVLIHEGEKLIVQSLETGEELSAWRSRSSMINGNIVVQVTRRHVYTFSLHSHNYIAFLNTWLSVPTISLYHITTKSTYRKEYELNLQKPGNFSFTKSDNLLLVHNHTVKSTLLFDVKSQFSNKSLLPAQTAIFEMNSGNEQDDSFSTSYPKYYISPANGKITQVSINLPILVEMLEEQESWSLVNLTQFIIRRKSPHSITQRLKPIRKAILTQIDLTIVRTLFDVLYINYESSTPKVARNVSFESLVSELSSKFSSSGITEVPEEDTGTISFQDDLFCHLFTPLVAKIPPEYMTSCILEFIESQTTHKQQIKSFIYELITHIMIKEKYFVQLHQLIKSEIIPDSIQLGKTLLEHGGNGRIQKENIQVGIDMLKRLECHSELLEAIIYAQQSQTLKFLSPLFFLEAALKDETLFLNIYKFFEEHGMIPLAMQMDLDTSNGGIARYVSVFRELWGPQIEMEGLD
ncbi:hypothetical protein HDV06_000561 [Boothiomyces sp. JEL0866]|nr:hypothetical protein HDV06_000561 [Boothiomyces sp. JEL0866]